MWLYSFSISSCIPGISVTSKFPDLAIALSDIHALAIKYDLPKLKKELASLFKTQCDSYAISTSGKAHLGSWCLPLLRHLTDRASPLSDIALATFRANVAEMFTQPEPEKIRFWEELQAWPKLGYFLLATGGLDGKACKFFQDGKLPPATVLMDKPTTPSPEVVSVDQSAAPASMPQVKPATPVTKVTPITPNTPIKPALPPGAPPVKSVTPVMPAMPGNFSPEVTPKTAVMKATPAKTKITETTRLSEKQAEYADPLSHGERLAQGTNA